MDNEVSKMWAERKKERQKKHREWKAANTGQMMESGLDFRVASDGEAFIFPSQGKAEVIFYPSTGRWHIIGSATVRPSTMGGGADKFIAWYRKHC